MIPAETLKLTLDTDNLTLDEAVLFDPEGFSLIGFKNFLVKYGSWSKKEVGNITLGELKDVAQQVGESLKDLSVPKGSESPSPIGPTDDQVTFPSGPST